MPYFRLPRVLLAVELALLAWTAVCRGQGDGQPIFNGRDLENWDGDKRFWSVAEGAIRGETSLASMPSTNTFLIWRGSLLKDF
jgi:hypothetical protein